MLQYFPQNSTLSINKLVLRVTCCVLSMIDQETHKQKIEQEGTKQAEKNISALTINKVTN